MVLNCSGEWVGGDGSARSPDLVSELCRAVNDRITELGDRWSLDEYEVICECADERCFRVLRMTPEQYESLRRQPSAFAVLPGHRQPADEVIADHDGFLVVASRNEATRPDNPEAVAAGRRL